MTFTPEGFKQYQRLTIKLTIYESEISFNLFCCFFPNQL